MMFDERLADIVRHQQRGERQAFLSSCALADGFSVPGRWARKVLARIWIR